MSKTVVRVPHFDFSRAIFSGMGLIPSLAVIGIALYLLLSFAVLLLAISAVAFVVKLIVAYSRRERRLPAGIRRVQ